MCLGDWKLAKHMKSSSTVVSVAASDTLLVSPSPYRVGLIISQPSGSNIRAIFDQVATADTGIRLEAASSPLQLTLIDNGDLVTREWRAISASGTVDVLVIETFYQEDAPKHGQSY